MGASLLAVLICILSLDYVVSQASNESLIVNTTSGILEGDLFQSVTGRSIVRYLGVPYAKPPVGELRFRFPEKYNSSRRIKANKKAKSCIQISTFLPGVDDAVLGIPPFNETSEDCLYLNIWVPHPKPMDAPVMFWIHGGGFQFGSGNEFYYDGDVLASEGVIVVNVNYRMSVFGFLTQDPEEIPGNMGLMDQSLGMQWVKDNIKKFGGDPNKVTIFGESAGAISVDYHLTIPSSQGLFQRAILMSGADFFSDKEAVHKSQKPLVTELGCDFASRLQTVSCLRSKNTTEYFSLVKKLGPAVLFNPIVDGYYVHGNPATMLSQGRINKSIDIMAGACLDDGAPFASFVNWTDDMIIDEATFQKFIKVAHPDNDTKTELFIKFLYTDYQGNRSSWNRAAADLMTDYMFMCYMAGIAEKASDNGNKVFFYEYGHKPSFSRTPKWLGATHAEELYFVFGEIIRKPHLYNSSEVEFSKKVVNYWTQFAKFGNPTPSKYPLNETVGLWPRYTRANPTYMKLAVKNELDQGIRPQRCYFRNKVVSQLKKIK